MSNVDRDAIASGDEFITHKQVRFTGLRSPKNKYNGPPSLEVDEAWKELYMCQLIDLCETCRDDFD